MKKCNSLLLIQLPFLTSSLAALVAVLGLMILAIVPAKADRSILIGEGLETFDLPKRASSRQCERACNKNRGCVGWTFIKAGTNQFGRDRNGQRGSNRGSSEMAQCRLLKVVEGSYESSCCVSGVFSFVGNQQGRQARCRRYANNSIEQVQYNRANSCGLSGPNWHGRSQDYYEECLISPKRSRKRFQARNEALAYCSNAATGRDNRAQGRRCRGGELRVNGKAGHRGNIIPINRKSFALPQVGHKETARTEFVRVAEDSYDGNTRGYAYLQATVRCDNGIYAIEGLAGHHIVNDGKSEQRYGPDNLNCSGDNRQDRVCDVSARNDKGQQVNVFKVNVTILKP